LLQIFLVHSYQCPDLILPHIKQQIMKLLSIITNIEAKTTGQHLLNALIEIEKIE
jgi:hypothetical protein